MTKLPLFILVWIGFIAIKLPIALLGLIVVPVLYRYRHKPFDDVPKIFLPWLNPEDWNDGHRGMAESLPMWWVNENGISFKSWFRYHAIRNPANGLRNFEFLDCDPNPSRIRFVTTGKKYRDRYEPTTMRTDGVKFAAYLAWQGFQAGTKIVYVWNDKRHLVFKFGWRIEPRDRYIPIDPNGTRVDDAGFATKFLPYREG
jgi:hypothetical protein